MNLPIIFNDVSIEIKGTKDHPLFNMRDLARSLGDLRDYSRKIKYLNPEDITRMNSKDESNRMVSTVFLTEGAMYGYVMRLKSEEAKVFQRSVYDMMTQWRKQMITPDMMEERITTGRLDMQKYAINEKKYGHYRRYMEDTPSDLADFYINQYFALLRDCESLQKNKHYMFRREDVGFSIINDIHKKAKTHFMKHDYTAFAKKVNALLDEERMEHAEMWVERIKDFKKL